MNPFDWFFNALTLVAHNWFSCSLYCFSFGLLFGLFLANEFHKVRCKKAVHHKWGR